MELKQAYIDIKKVIKKHKLLDNSDMKSLNYKADNYLFGVKLNEKYGININPESIYNRNWIACSTEYMKIGFFDGNKRSISWSDDDKQPKNEYLLVLSFSTGAYMFGTNTFNVDNDYPTKFFNKFFNELKNYNPKYIDSQNHSLYFSLDNAASIYNYFIDLLNKYNELNKPDVKARKIEKLKADIEKLENNN